MSTRTDSCHGGIAVERKELEDESQIETRTDDRRHDACVTREIRNFIIFDNYRWTMSECGASCR